MLPAWLAHYRKENLSSDLLAGVIVAVLVIPQSLAYALLAGLPPQAGLYASIFPVVVYAWLGSSSVQAVGPVAITAIMTFSVLSPLAAPGSAHYIELAAALALCSGLLTLAFGVMRLGFLSQLLSRPVVSGFISGSAVLIIISQLKSLLGVPATGSNSWQTLHSTLMHLQETNLVTLTLSAVALVWLLLSRYGLVEMARRLGLHARKAEVWVRVMPLVVLACASTAVVLLDLDGKQQVAVVGTVAEGVGTVKLFIPGLDALRVLLIPALIMAFIGTVQNITMGQAEALALRRIAWSWSFRSNFSFLSTSICSWVPVSTRLSMFLIFWSNVLCCSNRRPKWWLEVLSWVISSRYSGNMWTPLALRLFCNEYLYAEAAVSTMAWNHGARGRNRTGTDFSGGF